MSESPGNSLLLIVTGAHLRAEQCDRPLAYNLLKAIQDQLHHLTQSTDWPIEPLVCSDVWYVNHTELHAHPTISIGGPSVNALSAYLYEKLTTALAVEDKLVVQLDVEFGDLRSAVWGVDRQHTAAALDLFNKKYLVGYVRAVMQSVGE